MNRSPLLIRVMLACHTVTVERHRERKLEEWIGEAWGSAYVSEALQWLYDNDLVDANNKSTAKGKAWVDYIVNTPIPIANWILPPRADIPTEGREAGNGLSRLEIRSADNGR